MENTIDRYIHTKKAILERINELKILIDAEIDDLECRPHYLFEHKHVTNYDTSILKYWKDITNLKLQLENSKYGLEKDK